MRAHRTLVISAILALCLAVPAAAARPAADHRRLDLRPAARPETRGRLPQGHPQPAPKVTGGQSDIGISGADEGPLRHRRLLARPDQGVDPTGLVFTKIARDGVCIITNKSNPICNLSQETVEDIFTGRIRDWSASARVRRSRARSTSSTVTARLVRRTPSSTSSSKKARRSPPRATAKTSNGLEQNSVSTRQAGDRLRLLRLHGGRQRRRLQRRRVQPAQRALRAVPRRA